MKFQQKCLGRMGDAAGQEGRTVLYVSHNMNTIRQLCTRCIVLDHGKIIFDGDVERAIDIYMKAHGDVSQTKFDLSKKSSRNPEDTPTKLMGVRLMGKENAVYQQGEPMVFQADILARKQFEHLRFRFEIRYADDVPVGAMPDVDLGVMETGEHATFEMIFDTSWLTGGKYKVFIVLFERNEFGTGHDHDLVLPAFYFEIVDRGDITWKSTNWGHIRFLDMPFKKVY